MKLENAGKQIKILREKENLSKSKLCNGLCSVQNLFLIEAGEGLADMLLLVGLLERLGKSAERLTYILTAEEYRRLVLRDKIEEALRFGEISEAREAFVEYQRENPPGKNKILRMYKERICGILALEEYGKRVGEGDAAREEAVVPETVAVGSTDKGNAKKEKEIAVSVEKGNLQEETAISVGKGKGGKLQDDNGRGCLELAASYFMAAIERTISYKGQFGVELIRKLDARKKLLTMFEVENILLYLHVQWLMGNGDGQIELLEALYRYLGKNMQDDELRAQYFAKIGMLLGERYLEKEDYDACMKLHEEILQLNREYGMIVCVLPVLEQIIVAYTKLQEGEKARFYAVHKENLEAIFKEYKVSPDCVNKLYYTCYLRQYFLEGEVIAAERKWKGISQEELIEGIYQNTENLSRIETGKANSDRKKFYQLMEKLGIDKTRYNGNLITDEYEVLMLEKDIERLLAKGQYREANHELFVLEEHVDMGEKCNQQLVLGMKNMEMFRRGEMEVENAIANAKELLELTYHLDNLEKGGERYRRIPFRNEMYLFNQVCILLRRNGKIGKAIEIMERMIKTYDTVKEDRKFHFKNVHLCAINLCKFLEIEEQLEEAKKVADILIQEDLLSGKIASMYRLFATKFDICEKRGQVVKYGEGWLWKAYLLSEWCGYEKDYERLKRVVRGKQQEQREGQ